MMPFREESVGRSEDSPPSTLSHFKEHPLLIHHPLSRKRCSSVNEREAPRNKFRIIIELSNANG
jgi:hypothetical protein